jgi:acetyltransferase-like isoleucine patch superfamily enzyme
MEWLNHIWNHRLSGFFGATSLALAVVTRKVLNLFTTIIVRGNFQKTGKRVTIYRGIYYQNPSHINLGDDVFIRNHVVLASETKTGILQIDDGVTINDYCWIDFSGSLLIGSGSFLSRSVVIETHDHGFAPRSKPKYRSLKIGKGVWIGIGAVILANVGTIGDNSIIAAGSVVTKPVPKNCIVAGVPARVIRDILPAN